MGKNTKWVIQNANNPNYYWTGLLGWGALEDALTFNMYKMAKFAARGIIDDYKIVPKL